MKHASVPVCVSVRAHLPSSYFVTASYCMSQLKWETERKGKLHNWNLKLDIKILRDRYSVSLFLSVSCFLDPAIICCYVVPISIAKLMVWQNKAVVVSAMVWLAELVQGEHLLILHSANDLLVQPLWHTQAHTHTHTRQFSTGKKIRLVLLPKSS